MSLWGKASAEDLARLLSGADYGEAFLEISSSTGLRFEDSRLQDLQTNSGAGMSLRFLRRRGEGWETLFGSSPEISPSEAATIREQLLGEARLSRLPLGTRIERGGPERVPPEIVPLEQKISLMRGIDGALRREYPAVRQVTVNYAERRREIALVNSEGVAARDRRSGLLFSISVVCAKDGVLQTGFEVLSGSRGWDLFDSAPPLKAARAAAERAMAKLAAPKAKAGEMPVVLAASAGGTFIHEAIGHSLEADHVIEGSSPAYKGKLGRSIASEKITVVDDPSLPFFRGSFHFDDEGTPAAPTVLVKNGVLADYLYDRLSALKDGRRTNGHGRRESYASCPIPRMSNLYIAPGPDDPKEILQSLDAGLLVTRMGGGQVNTATGEFVFEVDEGWWVEKGEPRHQVRDANLLGAGPDVLRSIDLVGGDIGWGIGTCGKDGQGVPVSDAQPTLRIPKLLIGGKNE